MKKIDYMPEFNSIFKTEFVDYINYKRSLGKIMRKSLCHELKNIDNFFVSIKLEEKSISNNITKLWEESLNNLNIKPQTRKKKYSYYYNFCVYLNMIEYKNIVIPEFEIIQTENYIPYIFSKDEIQIMFNILNKAKKKNKNDETFFIMFSLYYCCGLRFSEVHELKLKHFLVKEKTLIIEKSKNMKTRIIPLSESIFTQLKKYIKNNSYKSEEDYIFRNSNNNHISSSLVRKKFHNLLKDASIPPRYDGGIQRIHDLRHTFAVHSLKQMEEKKFDLYTSLSTLCVYMGHNSIVETEYYLRLTQSELQSCLNKAYEYTKGIYKEDDNETDDEL